MLSVPYDDNEVEMTEIEGLVNVTSVGAGSSGGKTKSRSSGDGGGPKALDRLATNSSGCNRSRWFLATAFLITIVLVNYHNSAAKIGVLDPDDVDVKKPPMSMTRSDDDGLTWDNAESNTEVAALVKSETTTTTTTAPTPATKVTAAPTQTKVTASPTQTNVTTAPTSPPRNESEAVKIPTVVTAEDEAKKQAIIDKWGNWTFWDDEESIRPKEDYCAKYPHRDIPGDELPENAWQQDAVYANHFLDAASNLVARAQKAIYEEYGLGDDQITTDEQKMTRVAMFKLDMLNIATDALPKQHSGLGWTTEQSFQGLVRRLRHAIVTSDTFTVVMGGHSAAAGHGNHFKQSYMMSFHRLMEPIFDRLGVKLITRNLAQGGLGTSQSGLGSGAIYGDEVDVLLWDSQMTEKETRAIDLFFRQALLAGKRPPFIIGSGDDSHKVLKMLHEEAGVDVASLGTGMAGIPVTKDDVQVNSLPWAAQYLQCEATNQGLCLDGLVRFRTQCWIDRDDVTPGVKQMQFVGGRAKWHPGWRAHQLTGRVIAFLILKALEDAINEWNNMAIGGGYPLDDEYWHVTKYYSDMQEKVKKISHDPSEGFCEQYTETHKLTKRVCNVAMQARTEFTPRNDPDNTSIRSILKPPPNGLPSLGVEMLYAGPDVPNPMLEVPGDQLDIRDIVVNRRRLEAKGPSSSLSNTTSSSSTVSMMRSLGESIVPGSGWSLMTRLGVCDGSYHSICGREPTDNCLLSGHMDYRGGLHGDSLSGWIVMNLKAIKEGIILVKIETWHAADGNLATKGWTVENNAESIRRLRTMNRSVGHDNDEPHRRLKTPPPEFCDDYQFQYAIDGVVTTWSKDEFVAKSMLLQRVVEVFTLLDDEEMAKEGRERDVELAMRFQGCGRVKHLSLTHVYWA